ncbi:hypothetical protein BAE44_0001524, partial [Dichanthelium oligosanthes]
LPDLDAGRLHRLIRSSDLAVCFNAAEDTGDGQTEECPICFYFYPSLNRSKCCGKGICTGNFPCSHAFSFSNTAILHY